LIKPFQHSLQSQSAFAELSGDFNPVHLDPVRARRTMFGQVVTHGVHNVLCGIEEFLKNRPFFIKRIAVTFRNPIFLKEDVIIVPENISDNSALLRLKCGSASTAEIRLQGEPQNTPPAIVSLHMANFSRQPDNKTFAELENAEGTLKLSGDAKAINSIFPNSVQALGIDGVARLLSLTQLVGMRCPGLYSLFSGFDVTFTYPRSNEPTQYCVIRSDDRISLITMSVKGGGMTGTVNAFMRPPPILQPSISTVKAHISGTPFKKIRALVIGGSRGLGEISAKIIAAGGGETTITYLSGKEDAHQVAEDISIDGSLCKVIQMDVSEPTSTIQSLIQANWRPTHLLYFATPRISSRSDNDNRDEFYNIYSDGLIKVVKAIQYQSDEALTLFYPSSIYVVEPPADLTNYAAAKAKGETTAENLGKKYPHLNVIIERLKPLATDQSASLLNVDVAAPLETMVHLLTKRLC
jgi:short-subunit dehydrogenase